MRPLRICMVTTFYPPYHFGGDAVMVERLAHVLGQRGHSVEIVHDLDAFRSLAGARAVEEIPALPSPNVTVHSLRSFAGTLDLLLSHQLGRPILKARKLRRILDERAFDVIHYHNISLMGGPGILEYGKAIKLCTMHEYWLVCPMHVLWRYDREACAEQTCLRCTVRGRRPPQLWRYTRGLRKSGDHVDSYIAPSRFTRDAVLQRGFRGPIRVLPHFALRRKNDSDVTGADSAPVKPQTDTRSWFLFVGRLEKLKGIEELVDLFLSYDGAGLRVAGSGSLEPELRRRAVGAPHVRFDGWLAGEELNAAYSGAIATIVPSLCYETFGLVALESISMATPVIVRDLGALPEVVTNTGGGVTFRTREELIAAMDRFRNDPAERDRIGRQGSEAALRLYSEDEHLRQYLGLIEELEATRGRRSFQP